MCFSADGSRLACGGENTTILTWPIAPAPALPIVTLSTEQLQSRWADLTDPDAGRAFRSMTALHATPRQTLDLLRGHLHPVPAPDAARVKRWIAELDSDVFAVRQKATKELGKCGDAIEGALRQALAGKPSLEARRRMEDLLAKMTADTPERLRTVRALELLEGMHTTAAWQLLDELAHGAPSTWLTREAKAALHRVRAASTWQ